MSEIITIVLKHLRLLLDPQLNPHYISYKLDIIFDAVKTKNIIFIVENCKTFYLNKTLNELIQQIKDEPDLKKKYKISKAFKVLLSSKGDDKKAIILTEEPNVDFEDNFIIIKLDLSKENHQLIKFLVEQFNTRKSQLQNLKIKELNQNIEKIEVDIQMLKEKIKMEVVEQNFEMAAQYRDLITKLTDELQNLKNNLTL